ncbi:hypothetical protein Plhal304r1_c003g0013781 [Plasmopara halstedii]
MASRVVYKFQNVEKWQRLEECLNKLGHWHNGQKASPNFAAPGMRSCILFDLYAGASSHLQFLAWLRLAGDKSELGRYGLGLSSADLRRDSAFCLHSSIAQLKNIVAYVLLDCGSRIVKSTIHITVKLYAYTILFVRKCGGRILGELSMFLTFPKVVKD